jgi:hypothetical protein
VSGLLRTQAPSFLYPGSDQIVKRLDERDFSITANEHSLQSIRAVMARTADAIWQADAAGNVTSLSLCRPSVRTSDGELDETEIAQIEQLWRKCTRLVERFSANYHVRTAGSPARTFFIRAVPVLDERDAVQYWSGMNAETDASSEADTRFISEAAAVLSSSLNGTTILNRLAQASIDRFCDFCAVHTFADDGSVQLDGLADRRTRPFTRPCARASRRSCSLQHYETRAIKSSRHCWPPHRRVR